MWIYDPHQHHRQLWQYLPRAHRQRLASSAATIALFVSSPCALTTSHVPGRTPRSSSVDSLVRDNVARSGVDGCVQRPYLVPGVYPWTSDTHQWPLCIRTPENQTPSWEQKRWVRGSIPRKNQ